MTPRVDPGPQVEALVGKATILPALQGYAGPKQTLGNEGGGGTQGLHLPPLFPESSGLYFVSFAKVNQSDVSRATALFPKCPALEASPGPTLSRYRDRGFPRLPALPTPRGSDIRDSRGLIMQPARSQTGVRAQGSQPLGGSRAALTLLKFIQAAGAAEGAHGGRLPAAASLHPRGGVASE